MKRNVLLAEPPSRPPRRYRGLFLIYRRPCSCPLIGNRNKWLIWKNSPRLPITNSKENQYLPGLKKVIKIFYLIGSNYWFNNYVCARL